MSGFDLRAAAIEEAMAQLTDLEHQQGELSRAINEKREQIKLLEQEFDERYKNLRQTGVRIWCTPWYESRD